MPFEIKSFKTSYLLGTAAIAAGVYGTSGFLAWYALGSFMLIDMSS